LVSGLLAAAVLVTSLGVPAGAVDGPTRVMIVGDSVTHGSDGDYTWRYFSWRGLEQTGASVDFVGPHRATLDDGGYADPDFDQDHASRWGMAMREMLDGPDDGAPRISSLIEAHDPDVVVEALGVNDLTWLGMDAEDLAAQVRALVAEARATKSDVDIVLAGVPQTWIARVDDYNALLPALAVELSADDSRVVAAPVPDFIENVDTYDFAHPTTVGQVKIAAAVSVALERLGVGHAVTMPVPAVPGAHDPVVPPPSPPPGPAPSPTPVPEPTSVPDPTPVPGPGVPPAPEPPVVEVLPGIVSAALSPPSLRVTVQHRGWVRLSWQVPDRAAATRIWIRDLSVRRSRWTRLRTDVAAPRSSYRLHFARGHRVRFRAAAVAVDRISATSPTVGVRTR
jgi:hypothetical protein